jgi:hypothetical protein
VHRMNCLWKIPITVCLYSLKSSLFLAYMSNYNTDFWHALHYIAISVPNLHVDSPRKMDLKTKTSCSHLKILEKLIEICWRCLIMIVGYFMYISIPRSTHRSNLESKTQPKISHSHLKILENFTEIFLEMSHNDSQLLLAY